jgi:hypothetical protein
LISLVPSLRVILPLSLVLDWWIGGPQPLAGRLPVVITPAGGGSRDRDGLAKEAGTPTKAEKNNSMPLNVDGAGDNTCTGTQNY